MVALPAVRCRGPRRAGPRPVLPTWAVLVLAVPALLLDAVDGPGGAAYGHGVGVRRPVRRGGRRLRHPSRCPSSRLSRSGGGCCRSASPRYVFGVAGWILPWLRRARFPLLAQGRHGCRRRRHALSSRSPEPGRPRSPGGIGARGSPCWPSPGRMSSGCGGAARSRWCRPRRPPPQRRSPWVSPPPHSPGSRSSPRPGPTRSSRSPSRDSRRRLWSGRRPSSCSRGADGAWPGPRSVSGPPSWSSPKPSTSGVCRARPSHNPVTDAGELRAAYGVVRDTVGAWAAAGLLLAVLSWCAAPPPPWGGRGSACPYADSTPPPHPPDRRGRRGRVGLLAISGLRVAPGVPVASAGVRPYAAGKVRATAHAVRDRERFAALVAAAGTPGIPGPMISSRCAARMFSRVRRELRPGGAVGAADAAGPGSARRPPSGSRSPVSTPGAATSPPHLRRQELARPRDTRVGSVDQRSGPHDALLRSDRAR